MLDIYNGVVANIGQIHSLSTIHGVKLSLEDGNVNTLKVTSNILLPYEDKQDGCSHLKEKEGSFT